MDMIESLQGFVGENLSLLLPVDQAWQPSDFLPDLTGDDWADQLTRFRESARCLPDDLLVVLVGNMVTEEALPNYSVSLEQIADDPSGTTDTPWAHWLHSWTAKENAPWRPAQHLPPADGPGRYASIEVTIHHLVSNGFNEGSHDDDYAGLIYASFQERATRITHGNVGKLASARGGRQPRRICRKIAGDETRTRHFTPE